tara:strand:- start:16 stop:519 length:504 start_codon:yes stop_codon:yes gene_type:complete
MLGASESQPMNLLLNPDFSQVTKAGQIKHWTLYAKGQSIQTVTDADGELPKNCTTAMQIKIQANNGKQGSLAQKLRDLPPEKKLKLTAQVKATRHNIASLQVKLKAAGKEINRISSAYNTTQWKTLELIIPTANADELSIQLRFSQDDKAQDQTIWLTDLNLVDITE